MADTIASVKKAALLAEAREGLDDVRVGLKTRKLESGIWLKVEAFDGDDQGGSIHGWSLIPAYLGPMILNRIEELLDDELSALGVSPPRHRKS